MVQIAYHTLAQYFSIYGYWVIFVGVMLENTGIPVPGETVLLFAGFLAWQGRLGFAPAVLAGVAGATLGDNLGYAVGRFAGRRLIIQLMRHASGLSRSFERSEALYLKYGPWAVFAGRFVAGLRAFAGILAGVFDLPFWRFFIFNLSGAALWAVAVTGVGFAFGSRWPEIVRLLERVDRWTLLIVAGVVLGAGIGYAWRRARPRAVRSGRG